MAQDDHHRDRRSTPAPHQVMESARVRADLTLEDLWWRYVALGGTGDVFDLDAQLHGISVLGGPEHDVLAHALNEALGGASPASPAHLVPLPVTDAGVANALRQHLEDPTGCRTDVPPPAPAPAESDRRPPHGCQ